MKVSKLRSQVVQVLVGALLFAQAHAHGAHHDAVVQEHHMHLRLVLVGLGLGQDVGRGAWHHHHLGTVQLLEGREHVLRVRLLHGAAVHADVEGFGLRMRTGRCNGERGQQAMAQEAAGAENEVHGGFLSGA